MKMSATRIVCIVLIIASTDCVATSLVDIASGKPAVQTDTYANQVAGLATDGDPATYSHTSNVGKNWLAIDLLQNYHIHTIQIKGFPRDDLPFKKLENFSIFVSKANPLPIPVDNVEAFVGELCLNYVQIIPIDNIVELQCNTTTTHPIKGRFVYVWHPTPQTFLVINELRILVQDDIKRRQITSDVLYPGHKSSLTPIHSEVHNPVTFSSCLATCTTALESQVTHFQINKQSGRCECIQFSPFLQQDLGLTSDGDFNLCEITDTVRENTF